MNKKTSTMLLIGGGVLALYLYESSKSTASTGRSGSGSLPSGSGGQSGGYYKNGYWYNTPGMSGAPRLPRFRR